MGRDEVVRNTKVFIQILSLWNTERAGTQKGVLTKRNGRVCLYTVEARLGKE